MLGHEIVGSGPARVIVLNDWLCDTSTWDGARAYLDREASTWAFTDLRGYGRSIRLGGELTVEEAASDVLGLADSLGWSRFAVVGHSMSSLVALHLAQRSPDRIACAVVLTPPPPGGFGVDDVTLASMRAVARGDDDKRRAALRMMLGDRLSDGWLAFKLARWRETSDPEAVEGYVAMFARAGLPDPSLPIEVRLLAVTGEEDGESMRSASVTKLLTPLCPHVVVTPLPRCGHYPMQEMPPLLVATVESFVTTNSR